MARIVTLIFLTNRQNHKAKTIRHRALEAQLVREHYFINILVEARGKIAALLSSLSLLTLTLGEVCGNVIYRVSFLMPIY